METKEILIALALDTGAFTEAQADSIADEMAFIINAKFMYKLSSSDLYRLTLEEANSLKDAGKFEEYEAKIAALFAIPEVEQIHAATISEVILDWFENISPTLTEEQRAKLLEKIQNASQQ
jgi:hypothetical protein